MNENKIVGMIGLDEAISNLPNNYEIKFLYNINYRNLHWEVESIFLKVPGGSEYLASLSYEERVALIPDIFREYGECLCKKTRRIN